MAASKITREDRAYLMAIARAVLDRDAKREAEARRAWQLRRAKQLIKDGQQLLDEATNS